MRGGGGVKKNKKMGKIAKKGGLQEFADLREGLAEKRWVVFIREG